MTMWWKTQLAKLRWRRRPLVTVVRLAGIIGEAGMMHRGLTLAGLADTLDEAFAPGRLAAVALLINSPGGSPVQSALIAGRIQALATEKKVPVLAFVEDVAASGGYWLATAADEITADASSVLGSIGVVSAGFGFPELLRRHGVERRVYTAGTKKALLDPFRPEDPEDVAHLKALQQDIHDSFKAQVRARRGARLKGSEELLFSGEFWTGTRALEYGLIDALGDARTSLRARFGDKVRLRLIGERRRWWPARLGLAQGRASGIAESLVNATLAALVRHMWWSRYGL